MCRANVAQSRCGRVKRQPPTALPPSTGQAFGTSDRERRNWHDARMRTARGAGGGRRALQQDMEQFTAISTLRGIMFLSRGNVYHGSSEFARFHHFEKMLFMCISACAVYMHGHVPAYEHVYAHVHAHACAHARAKVHVQVYHIAACAPTWCGTRCRDGACGEALGR